MKLAIVFLLFSIIVFSDAFAKDDYPEEAKHIAEMQFYLFNSAIADKDEKSIRMMYDVQPDTDDNADKIIAEYEPFLLVVEDAGTLDSKEILALVRYFPKSAHGAIRYGMFKLQKVELSYAGWKISKISQ